jgi:hypothetical protein
MTRNIFLSSLIVFMIGSQPVLAQGAVGAIIQNATPVVQRTAPYAAPVINAGTKYLRNPGSTTGANGVVVRAAIAAPGAAARYGMSDPMTNNGGTVANSTPSYTGNSNRIVPATISPARLYRCPNGQLQTSC